MVASIKSEQDSLGIIANKRIDQANKTQQLSRPHTETQTVHTTPVDVKSLKLGTPKNSSNTDVHKHTQRYIERLRSVVRKYAQDKNREF